jgi:uncharacterized protein YndB with AHSA1/START domain
MGDIVHKKSIAAPPTAVFAALTEQHHPKSSLHSLFTG